MKRNILALAVGMALSSTGMAEVPASNNSNNDLMNVQNRCIVQMNSNINSQDVRGLAKKFAARGNSSLTHVYKNSIKGFTINMPCHAAAAAFGADDMIMSMEPDSIISISKGKPGGGGGGGGQQVSYGTARVGGAVDGTGYTAWVIDSGVDLDHPDLNVDTVRAVSFVRGDADDQNGHGTHVAGTIGALDNSIGSLGVAPNTTIVPVRVLDRRGSGSTSGVIGGIDYVAANASPGDCANMSLGGGVSQSLDDAVTAAAQSSGAFFVLAAGNDGDDANNHSPARANGNNVYTISATDVNDNMPSWSNYGNPPVDFAAPGVSIFSLWKSGGTNTISGTSMASPHACAVIMMTGGHPSSDGTAGNDPDGNADSIIHL
ncbi:MAG: S8 family peptidase [Proteobacteria bacterium]|nr:S8 family peptidase [Pseudomonadota bacterium]